MFTYLIAPVSRSLRRLGLASAFLATIHTVPAVALEERVVVVTSYPEELTTRFEAAFEKVAPGVHVQIVWKQGRDAFAELSRPDHGGADVYWAPSLDNFRSLADRGLFAPLTVDRTALPGKVGAQMLSDPQNRYEATEIAGYGVAVNPEALRARNLAPPSTWRDLAAPGFADLVSMPIASRVGFSPVLYDMILQSEGWSPGWALIGEIAANAGFASSSGGPVASVGEGSVAAALTIDFLAISAAANGRPVRMVYPSRTAFGPAHVAVLADAPHPQAARAFVDFLLSRDGQKLAMHRDIGRHAVRPDAYADMPDYMVNPFDNPAAYYAFDSDLARLRRRLVAALFDIAVVERNDEDRKLWRALQAAEAAAGPNAAPEIRDRLKRARERLGYTPVADSEATKPEFLRQFGRAATGSREDADPATLAAWRAAIAAARQEAAALLGSRP